MSQYSKLFYIFCIFLNIKTALSYCVMGDNCPYDRATCLGNYCSCVPGYKTLITDQNIEGNLASAYCTYKQTSRYVPLILEVFIPPLGHIYVGRYFHALVKFILIIPLIFRQKGNSLSLFMIILFIFLYFTDILCYFTALYRDGNGIPLY